MQKKTTSRAVGVIGLGIMGSAMAVNLQAAGFSVHGVEIRAATRKKLAPHLSIVGSQAEALLPHTRHLITSLPSSAALHEVCAALAKEALSLKIRSGTFCVAETSTLPLSDKLTARDVLAEAGIDMIDAPLSGTGAQAKTKDLQVYASGNSRAIRAMKAIFEGFARAQYDVGEFGNGMKMKLVANLMVAIHNVSAAEAVLFGKRLGLDPKMVVDVVGDGAGSSRMFQVRGPMMASRQWKQATMKVEIWQKDMAIISEALRELAVPAPLFAACIPVYHAAIAQGHRLHDTASVYAVLERMAGGD
ncbi:MAG: NAD(P)-dependent oxidoreductase [Gammaproteobacteria bacterium]|nr:NAD(P)-dependent oxidoreductase [Gammaproteobacteria bacterium]MBU0788035.1 NAD(P)-dependent oxidoreductase [Gammaproteobacteria bacterium]MBU0815467.1 NAD(P)-dependent oxidoreductase [Gammaproteobacteria bacterium]MBU1785425.1 NAD(P)-dependent oxidoreductase [Gammaproteobacteria bacterium]